ncbi:MAG: response regulator [Pseudohongiellaceae bacterium]
MPLKNHLLDLWNGGLDPDKATPDELRERRTLSACIIAISPLGILVMGINTFRGLSGDNPTIAAGIAFGIFALYVQAKLGNQKIAANMPVFGLWAMLVLIMRTSGILGQTWIWLLAIPAIATLLAGLRSGIIWSAIVASTVWIYTWLHLSDRLNLDAEVQIIDRGYIVGLATEGTLVLFLLCASVLIFRHLQNSAENKLKDTVASLKNEIESRILAEEKAQSSERAKSTFLAAMSHELRTPMNGVIGALRLLQESDSEKEKSEYALVAKESGELLLELINNIMDLSSLESGAVAMEKIPVDLGVLIHKTMAPFKFQAESKSVELTIEIDESMPSSIMGDPTRLRQVLINLVGNALKFTHQGEVKLHIEYVSSQLKMTVSDTGIGIAKEAQASLFEPYVQADISTNREFGGSGLGLSIVKSLVTHMEGTIELNSIAGKGTKIEVFIPVDACALQVNERSHANPLNISPLKILIADDNAVNRMVLSRLLEKDDHSVVTVTNGREAVNYVETHAVDAVLMDIQMPELDGIAATTEIRRLNGRNANIPIIAITASTDAREVERMLASGMNGYFAKPFRYEEIQEALDPKNLTLTQPR